MLLITVDALRADLLRAYGGHGLTPELDRAGQRERGLSPRLHAGAAHVVRARQPAHGQVHEAGARAAGRQRATTRRLPDLLRRYGYRTAAFYPPAIFFVDGARFRALRERGFGFEYRKEMFASADGARGAARRLT